MTDLASEKIIRMRLDLPASWNKKLNLLAALSGEPKAGARTQAMKAISAWIANVRLPETGEDLRKKGIHGRKTH